MVIDVFKIDSIHLRLQGNYIDILKDRFHSISDDTIKDSRDSKNVSVYANRHYLYFQIRSVSRFLSRDINHSNIDLLFNAVNDYLNINDIEFSVVTRLDICTDLYTDISIHKVSNRLGKLTRFKRTQYEKTLYYNTSKKGRGTVLKLYQKKEGMLRFEMTSHKKSKYIIKSANDIKIYFVSVCVAAFDYYLKIQKIGKVNLIKAKKYSDLPINAYRMIYNKLGIEGINELIKTIDNASHGYKMKKRIIEAITDDSQNVAKKIEDMLRRNLDNTKAI